MSQKYAQAILERETLEHTSKAEVDKHFANTSEESNLLNLETNEEVFLPEVPIGSTYDYEDTVEARIDKEIEERLLRLKFFNQSWFSKESLLNSPLKTTTSVIESPHQKLSEDELN